MPNVTTRQLKLIQSRALDAYNKAIDRQIAAKKATLAAWENYEQRHRDYTESLLEETND